MQNIRKPPPITNEKQRLGQIFYSRAVDYYILTRLAYRHGIVGTIPYVSHQAFEHLLKGGLAELGTPLRRLKKLDHDLPGIFSEYISVSGQSDLEMYTDKIQKYHKQYILRYPRENEGSHNVSSAIHKLPFRVSVSIRGEKIPNFGNILENFDELFANLAKRVHHEWIKHFVHKRGWEHIYGWENLHTLEKPKEYPTSESPGALE